MAKKFKTIGDIHGKTIWKPMVHTALMENVDKIIFLGDYVDGWDISNEQMLSNLKDIIKTKKLYPDKTILLWGNHEGNYAWTSPNMNNPYACSGYRPDMHYDLYDIFQQNKDLFQLAYQYENYLWTHAGVHKGWYKYKASPEIFELGMQNSAYTIADQLNTLFDNKKSSIFNVGQLRGGFHEVGGPLWLDKRMSSQKPLEGVHQIVGHSKVDKIETITIDYDTSITFCDGLDNKYPLSYDLKI